MLDVIASTMRSALMSIMTKRGIDPRDPTRITFGDAGSIHACLLAQEINVPRVLIAPSSGTTCALGAVIADFKAGYIRSFRAPFGRHRHRRFERRFSRDGDGKRGARLTGQRKTARRGRANHRFGGYPLYRPGLNSRSESAGFAPRSDRHCRDRLPVPRHLRGRLQESYPSAAVELTNLRIRIAGQSAHFNLRQLLPYPTGSAPESTGHRQIGHGGRFRAAAVFDPESPLAGHKVTGPAIVEQYDTIAVVAPGFVAGTNAHGILSLTDSY